MITHVENILLEAASVTGVALQYQVCHELHLYSHHSCSLALLASAALGVEREVLRRESLLLCERLVGKELADGVVGFHVCGRVRACALANRVLVYKLYVRQLVPVAFERRVVARHVSHLVEMALEGRVEYAFYQRRLARTAHAGDYGHHVQRNLHVDAAQVVHACALYVYRHVPRAARLRNFNHVLTGKIAHGVAHFAF